ncbi:MAG: Mth938-like domain-containing protein [Alphaproteobacteria bacterium]
MSTSEGAEGASLFIQSYGNGRFRISGTVHASSVLVSAARVLPWDVAALAGLSVEAWIAGVAPLLSGEEPGPRPQILLIGCGETALPVPDEVRAWLRDQGAVAEAMNTGAACRTFNVLRAEDRLVAAALIAVP